MVLWAAQDFLLGGPFLCVLDAVTARVESDVTQIGLPCVHT